MIKKLYYEDDKRIIELFLDMILSEKNLATNTINSYSSDLLDVANYFYSNKIKMIEVSKDDLDEWLNFLSRQNYSNKTKLRRLSSIKQFMNFLNIDNYRKDNPSLNLSVPKANKILPKYLSEKEVSKLLSKIYNDKTNKGIRMNALTELLYATGLRVSELVSLKMSDLSENFLSLIVNGKGNKERFIPIGEKAREAIINYLNIRDSFQRVKSVWLFPSRRKHITRQTYYNYLKEYSIKAGLNNKLISPHSIRHSFASHMLSNGADLRVIQTLLGHSDISTVEIYTHIQTKDIEDAIQKHPLNNFFFKD